MCLGIIPPLTCSQETQFAQMLDFYLSGKKHGPLGRGPETRTTTHSRSIGETPEVRPRSLPPRDSRIWHLRTVTAQSTTTIDGNRKISVKQDDPIFADFVTAAIDPTVFPDPLQSKLDRPDNLYFHHGYGRHVCFGRPIMVIAMAVQLHLFARLIPTQPTGKYAQRG